MSRALFVATQKGLFRVDRGSSTWDVTRASFLGDPVSITLRDPRDGGLYAALDLGPSGVELHRSDDGGETWTEIAAPAFPPQPEGVEDELPDGKPQPLRVEKIWSLEAGLSRDPGLLWCGTIPGGLFVSRDRGASWDRVRGLWDHPSRRAWVGGGELPGIHSICVDREGVTVGVSCGGAWRSTDGGATWHTRSQGMLAELTAPERREDPVTHDVHRIVQCAAAPDCLWTQHHNGVFRSVDDGQSWQNIAAVPPAVFGFAVAVHPRDPEVAWLIPAQKDEKRIPVEGKVVVARTRNGGESWEVLRRGLPQEHAYDIVYRHALDIDATGDRLAFGSTTGALWVTEDQGDSWQCVSTHLPPIYCVRFAE